MRLRLIIGGVFAVSLALFLLNPKVQGAREAARRTACKNNLRQIGIALYAYHDSYGCFPPAFIADDAGRPMHSWRVLILPFLDQKQLYSQYSFSEPWDGPNNSRLLSSIPEVYQCPTHSAGGSTSTAYAGVFGENCIFRGAEPVRIAEVTDALNNTLIVGESTGASIPWSKPQDIDVAKTPKLGDAAGFSSDHAGGVQVLSADGSVRFIPNDRFRQETVNALYTRSGGEDVSDY